jgi:isopentenyl-diphosphate delta-isomerase
MPSPDRVILVDAHDRPVGTAGKLDAHLEGRLHRAFSVFVFDAAGHLLVQKRDAGKYHCGGLWSNTCCSHPPPDASIVEAARQRLDEEMGFSCELGRLFDLTYRVPVGGGLVEHEYDHVFAARLERRPAAVAPDPKEVADWRWVAPNALRRDVAARPQRYTPWFRLLLDPALQAADPAGFARGRSSPGPSPGAQASEGVRSGSSTSA